MKLLKTIVVVILIFGLPAGSYLYLRSGFMYRLDTLEILKEKTPLTKQQERIISERELGILDRFNGGVSLFQRINSKQDTTDLYFLAESFKNGKDFQLIALATEQDYQMIDDTVFSNSLYRVQEDEATLDEFFGDSRFLLAKDSFIRKVYPYGHEEFLRAYEHTVVLLPMKKPDKVKLVRNKSTN